MLHFFSTDFTTKTAAGLLISAIGLLIFTQVKMKRCVLLELPKPRSFVIFLCVTLLCFNQFFVLPRYFPGLETDSHDEPGNEVNLRMMVVPFEAYVMNEDSVTMEHRTCKKTIIVRRLQEWKDQPFAEYLDGKSDLPFQATKNLVCLQVGSTVGAMILSYSNQSLEDGISFLRSDGTELVVKKLEHELKKSRIDLEVEIVERKTIFMQGWYTSPSLEAVQKRRKDGNFGNFVWQYGATRMINPYTTEFIPTASGAAEEEVSALVLASANAFHLNLEEKRNYSQMKNYVGTLTNLVKKFDKPTVLLGIGIQAKFKEIGDTNSMKLHEHQAAFLNEIGRRNQATTSVSVRGDITQTAAINAGVTNTISLGCPR